MTFARSRPAYYVWSLLVSPLIGTLVALFGGRDVSGSSRTILLFIGLPALLALAAAVAVRRSSVDAIGGAIGAAVTGALNWFLVVLWIAAQGLPP